MQLYQLSNFKDKIKKIFGSDDDLYKEHTNKNDLKLQAQM